MSQRSVEERLDALEEAVAELQRRAAARLGSTEAAGILSTAREQGARAEERAHHLHARATDLAEQAHMLDEKARRTHEDQRELEERALRRDRDG